MLLSKFEKTCPSDDSGENIFGQSEYSKFCLDSEARMGAMDILSTEQTTFIGVTLKALLEYLKQQNYAIFVMGLNTGKKVITTRWPYLSQIIMCYLIFDAQLFVNQNKTSFICDQFCHLEDELTS